MDSEQWILFWTAFGAIGTTIGSMITAIAVAIAVKQYRQPLTKYIEVSHGIQFPIYDYGLGPAGIYISIKNKGIRTINVSSVYLKGKSKLYLNNIQYPGLSSVSFPTELRPEDNINFSMELVKFEHEIEKMVAQGVIKRNCNLRIVISDTLGKEYFDKKKVKIRRGKFHR